jgi:hypothetical protein
MLMRRLTTGIMAIAVALATVSIARKTIAAAERSVARVPFVAKQVTSMYDSHGVLRHQLSSTYAIRRDGSWVELRTNADGRSISKRVIFDLGGKRRTTVIASTKSTTTYPLSKDELSAMTRPNGENCSAMARDRGELKLQVPLSGAKTTLLDREVVHFLWQSRPAGSNGASESVEEWLAPSLNCYPMKEIVSKSRPHAKEKGARTVTEVLSVQLGDPDPSMFSIPPDYTEKPPSQVISEQAEQRERKASDCEFARGELDKAYYSHRGAE